MDYPDTLPCFLYEGYGVAPRQPVLETDFGLAVRRRQTYADMREEIAVSCILSSEQEQTFREFHNVTTEMGSLPFDAPLFINGANVTREATFIGDPPSYTPVAPGYVKATATLLTT